MNISGNMAARRAELFEDMIAFLSQQLGEYGVQKGGAEAIANALADHLAEYWGGQLINITQDYRRMLSQREIEIYGLIIQGVPMSSLSRDYGISERGLYKLRARVRERLRQNAKGHPQLFETS